MKFSEKTKNTVSFFLRFVISAVFLFLVFKWNHIDISQLWSTLKRAHAGYLLMAALVFVSINFILLWRWYIFVRALNLKVHFKSIIRWFFIGLFCNLFLPTAIGGDIVKTIGLCQETSEKPKVFASAILDRLSGFAGIVAVASVAFIAGSSWIRDSSIGFAILVMAAVSLAIGAVLFNHSLYSLACRMFHRWGKIKDALMRMHYDIVLLKDRKKDGFLAVGLSCLAQVILAVVFYLLARGLKENIPFVYFLVFSPLVCVTATVPSIGGLGYLLSTVGVSEGIAVSLSLIVFLYMAVVGLIGGVIYGVTLSSGRIQHYQTDRGAGL